MDHIDTLPDGLFRELIETMNEAVWVGDAEERTIYANQKFCDLLEYSLDEILGLESYIFWEQSSQETVRRVNATKRKKGIRSTYEGYLVSKSGKYIPVLLSGAPLKQGGTIGIMTNLTELKKLQKREKLISHAISIVNDCIFSYDKDGKITSWNKGAKMVFGYNSNDALGLNINQIFVGEKIASYLFPDDRFSPSRFHALDKKGSDIVLTGGITSIASGLPIGEQEIRHEYLFIGRSINHQIDIESQIHKHSKKVHEAYIQLGFIQRQKDYLQDLIQHALKNSKDAIHIIDFALSALLFLSEAELIHFWKYTNDDHIQLQSLIGKCQLFPKGTKRKIKDDILHQSLLDQHILKIIEPHKQIEFSHFSAFKAQHSIYGVMIIPLGSPEHPLGILEVYISENHCLDVFENRFIEEYCRTIELALRGIS